MRFAVGDLVTVKEPVEAYYSRYGFQPECYLEPGDVGVVAAIDVPCVINLGHKVFACVDFTKHGTLWRAGVYYENLRRLHE